MSSRFSRSRKCALQYLDIDESSSMSYSDIAKRIVFKECAVVEGLDLNNKSHARALIQTWAFRKEIRASRHGTI